METLSRHGVDRHYFFGRQFPPIVVEQRENIHNASPLGLDMNISTEISFVERVQHSRRVADLQNIRLLYEVEADLENL